mmetsp:Transcript_1942/g.4897  ORF Transcript_1942/g.4897 Transcript_1942/m.4897 type:complete len:233 (-) Transcript_1942:161-859(-)
MARRPRGLLLPLLCIHRPPRPPRHKARKAQEGGWALLHPVGVGLCDLGANLPPRDGDGGLSRIRARVPGGPRRERVAAADGSLLRGRRPAPGGLDPHLPRVGPRQALDPRPQPHSRGVRALLRARRHHEGPRCRGVDELVRVRGCRRAHRLALWMDVLRGRALLEQCPQRRQGATPCAAGRRHILVLRRGGAPGPRVLSPQGPHPGPCGLVGALGRLHGARGAAGRRRQPGP